MRLEGLDLNLLVALDAILTDRNITRAAQRMCITQPAMSNTLARLREHFGDELVTRSGRSMVLTVRAEGLIEPLRDVLTRVQSLLEGPPVFDPTTSTREFSLLTSDYTLAVLVQPLMQELAATAPGVRFSLRSQAGGSTADDLDRGEIDLLIVPERFRSELQPARRLFEESYVCVTWRDNTRIREQLTLADYCECGHVTAQFGDGRLPTFDTWLMRREGVPRRAEVVVASLTALPALVIGTQRIATVHRRLAEAAARVHPLRIWPAPIEIPPLVEYVQWNRARREDPGLRWLLAELTRVAAAL